MDEVNAPFRSHPQETSAAAQEPIRDAFLADLDLFSSVVGNQRRKWGLSVYCERQDQLVEFFLGAL